LAIGALAGGILSNVFTSIAPAPFVMLGIGVISLMMGYIWYGWDGLGIRGGRPLMSGIGFAFLGWLALLLARFVSIGIGEAGRNLFLTFLYLLLVEALCVQIWCFGLFFRSMADWQRPLTATWLSGVLFGLAAFYLYREATIANGNRLALIYFIVWGLFYAIIRLRSGSLLGVILVQAMQTLTVWHLLLPDETVSLPYLYGIAGVLYIVLIWRLLPRYTNDFRV
jgi:hypothetical protein